MCERFGGALLRSIPVTERRFGFSGAWKMRARAIAFSVVLLVGPLSSAECFGHHETNLPGRADAPAVSAASSGSTIGWRADLGPAPTTGPRYDASTPSPLISPASGGGIPYDDTYITVRIPSC